MVAAARARYSFSIYFCHIEVKSRAFFFRAYSNTPPPHRLPGTPPPRPSVSVTTCSVLSGAPLTACQAAAQPPFLRDAGEDGQPCGKREIEGECVSEGEGEEERKEGRGGGVGGGEGAAGTKQWSETWLSFCHLFRVRDAKSRLWGFGSSMLFTLLCRHTHRHTRMHALTHSHWPRQKYSACSFSPLVCLLSSHFPSGCNVTGVVPHHRLHFLIPRVHVKVNSLEFTGFVFIKNKSHFR